MSYILIVLFLILLTLCALLNLVTLPGNWVMAVLIVLWAFLGPGGSSLSVVYFIMLFGLAVAGEVVEFSAQIWGAKKYGASNTTTVMGMLGAIIGAILCAPFFFGIGAVFGALAGAWTGSFLSERLLSSRPTGTAVAAANGALLGRFLGMTVKFGLGITMVVLTASTLWPS